MNWNNKGIPFSCKEHFEAFLRTLESLKVAAAGKQKITLDPEPPTIVSPEMYDSITGKVRKPPLGTRRNSALDTQ